MSEGDGAAHAYRSIRELARDERPRERLLQHGAGALADAELIALLLGSGLRGENVVDLARRVLEGNGGLHGLTRATAKRLARTKGVGPAKAAQLAAAIELGRRAHQLEPEDRPLLDTAERTYRFLAGRFLGLTREVIYVVSLDTRARMLGSAVALSGGVNSVALRAGDIFREPILLEATSIVIAHNHPSGEALPSREDIQITRELIAAGALLGIRVEDHIVVGQGRYFSLRESGVIPGWRGTDFGAPPAAAKKPGQSKAAAVVPDGAKCR